MNTLLSVASHEPKQQRKGRIQAIMLLCFMSLLILLTVASLIRLEWMYVVQDSAILLGMIGIFFLNRKISTEITGYLLLLLMLSTTFLTTKSQVDIIFVNLAVPITLASFLLVPWASFPTAAVALILTYLIRQQPPSLFLILLLVALAAIAWLGASSLDSATKEAEANSRSIEQANVQLQAEMGQREQLLADQERVLNEQSVLLATVRELSIPIIPVFEDVLVLPLIGTMTKERMRQSTDALLDQVSERGSQVVLIDLTGISLVDTATASDLIRMAKSVRLLGCRVIITGVRAELARTLVQLQVGLGDVPTFRDLQSGIEAALHSVGAKIVRPNLVA